MKIRQTVVFLLATFYALFGFELTDKIPTDPDVKIGKFDNGLTYYIRENAKPENRAQLWLVVNAGSVLENEQQQGYAHLDEHMAFNGTKNFAKQELIDYLESIGMQFGPEINAYTSFDETVYMLQLPTENDEMMGTGFQILEDWAHQVSYEDEEITKERGVVVEEWRLGRGAGARIRDKQFPILFQDSQYAVRLPIGKIELLQNDDNASVHQFYKQWYRPELMAVVAVGDFDSEHIYSMIKKHFASIPNPENALERKYFDVPDHKETLFAIASDPEQPRTMVSIYFKQPILSRETVGDYRRMLVESLFNQMLNERLNELTRQADPPFIVASSSKGMLVRTKNVYALGALVKEDGIGRSLDALLTEGLRVKRFGFTETELERAKIALLRGYERAFNERDKTDNQRYTSEYSNNFLENEPIPGITWEFEVAKTYVPGISLQELNELATTWITDGNRVVLVDAPEKADLAIPTEAELAQVIADVEKKDITAYEDNTLDIPLIAELPTPGKIVATKEIPEIDAVEWTLSNGTKVVLKSTDFKNDEILFSGFRWGGSSLASDDEFLSARASSAILNASGLGEFDPTALQKKLAGKIVRSNPSIGSHSENISGSSSPQDIETLFQLIYLGFTAPRQDDVVFESFKSRYKAYYQNRAMQPEVVFSDTVTAITNSYNQRAMAWKAEDFDKIDLNTAFNFYKTRFADAGGFTFFFVGNFTQEDIKPLILTYIGGLPNLDRENKWQDENIITPDGVIEKTVYKGIEEKARVRLIFHGDYEWNPKNNYALESFEHAFSIKLREVLREDKSGTYGVGVNASYSRIPKQEYTVSISWGCDPQRVDELVETVFSVIDSIQTSGFKEEYITKTRESQLRSFETDQKENNFWLSRLNNSYQNDLAPKSILLVPEKVKDLNAALLQETAQKYLKKDNYFRFVLLPETAEQ